jgi:hypothetical protein
MLHQETCTDRMKEREEEIIPNSYFCNTAARCHISQLETSFAPAQTLRTSIKYLKFLLINPQIFG